MKVSPCTSYKSGAYALRTAASWFVEKRQTYHALTVMFVDTVSVM